MIHLLISPLLLRYRRGGTDKRSLSVEEGPGAPPLTSCACQCHPVSSVKRKSGISRAALLRSLFTGLAISLVGLWAVGSLQADPSSTQKADDADDVKFQAATVRRAIQENCFICHSEELVFN